MSFSHRLRAWTRSAVLPLLFALQIFPGLVQAQTTFGSFVGTVMDTTSAVIPDCVVTATNLGTAAVRSAITDGTGNYVLVNLSPGTYQLEFQAPGFQTSTYSNLELLSRQTVRIDGIMGAAAQTQSISVNANVEPVITTEVSNISTTKTGRELRDLPVALASRASGSTSPISTLTTQPGVQTDSSGRISVAGAKPSQLSVSVDGISTMSVRSEAPIAELFPSFGAIAEIRVSEINNAAEFGGVSDITTVSKGGTNQFHGGLFENSQNTAFNARNPFSATKTKVIMNNFGLFGGGPVKIPGLYDGTDRTFFFSSYEGLRLPRQTFINQSVPSLALRQGDLSAFSKLAKDPTTGAPFPDNKIPISQISPIALNALQYLYPLPNTGSPDAIANNYTTNFGTPISSNQGDMRVDRNIGLRQTFFTRVTYKQRQVQSSPTGTIFAGPTVQPERYYTVTAAHNFIISPSIINELRLGVSDEFTSRSTNLDAQALVSKIGIPVPDPPGGSASPAFSINGFQSTSSSSSSVNRSHTLQLLDNVIVNRGSHTLKFGADIRRMTAYFSNVFATDRSGRYTFNGSVTNSIIGVPYAAFLLGIPDRTGVGSVNAPDSNSASTHWAFYGQDDWKITPRLTVNYGLRWEYHPPFLDRLHNMAVVLPNYQSTIDGQTVHGAVAVPDAGLNLTNPLFAASIAPTPILTASQANIPQQLHTNQKTDFAPRIGFAWRPTDKTVIRGGYGKYIEAMLGTLTLAGWAVSASSIGTYTNQIVDGKPTLNFPYPFPTNLAQPGTQDFRLSGDVNYRDPYVQQWNFTIEQAIGWNTGVRISYDGSHGTNLGYRQNINQIPSNTLGYEAAKGNAPYPQFARILSMTTGARSNYNSLTVAVTKRTSSGLTFQSSYVFAKNLSNGQGFNPTGFTSQSGGSVTDIHNINLDYGPVAFTSRHRFLTTFLYELPNKANAQGIVKQITNGWQLSGVLLFQSGPFLTVLAPGADPMGTNFPNFEGSGRADIVSGVPLYPADQSIRQWINPDAFVIPQNNIGRAGNSSVGSAVGPGLATTSLSLFKTFPLTESVSFQLGAAASNLLNHPNYAAPNLNLGTAAFGTIRNVQSQDNGGPRSMQLTGRITF